MGKQQELVCPISPNFPRLAINFEHLMCLPELYIRYSIVRRYIYRHVAYRTHIMPMHFNGSPKSRQQK